MRKNKIMKLEILQIHSNSRKRKHAKNLMTQNKCCLSASGFNFYIYRKRYLTKKKIYWILNVYLRLCSFFNKMLSLIHQHINMGPISPFFLVKRFRQLLFRQKPLFYLIPIHFDVCTSTASIQSKSDWNVKKINVHNEIGFQCSAWYSRLEWVHMNK